MTDIEKIAAERDSLRWIVEFNRRDRLRLVDKVARADFAASRATVLFAALERLHSQTDRASVLAAIEDNDAATFAARAETRGTLQATEGADTASMAGELSRPRVAWAWSCRCSERVSSPVPQPRSTTRMPPGAPGFTRESRSKKGCCRWASTPIS